MFIPYAFGRRHLHTPGAGTSFCVKRWWFKCGGTRESEGRKELCLSAIRSLQQSLGGRSCGLYHGDRELAASDVLAYVWAAIHHCGAEQALSNAEAVSHLSSRQREACSLLVEAASVSTGSRQEQGRSCTLSDWFHSGSANAEAVTYATSGRRCVSACYDLTEMNTRRSRCG